MLRLVLDYETYWTTEYSLSKMPTAMYVRSPDFHAFGAAVKVNDRPTRWLGERELPVFLDKVPWDQTVLIGHNLPFDGLVLAERYGKRPKLYLDTLGMSRAVLGGRLRRHNLDSVGEHLGFGGKLDKGKALNNMRGVRHPTREQYAALAMYAVRDAELTSKIAAVLLKSFPHGELSVLDWTVRMMTEPVLDLDTALLEKLWHDEVRKKEQAIAALGVDRVELNSNDRFAKLLIAAGVTPPMKQGRPTKKDPEGLRLTYAFAKTDEDFVALQEHPDPTVRALVEARLGVKTSQVETRARTYYELSKTGPMTVALSYSGAQQTHRLSGADGLNQQNLPRKGGLRKAIRAPKGYVLVVSDSSQIELRVCSKMAGQTDILDTLTSGGDLYSSFASELFGKPVSKKENPDLRQIGKVACIAEGSPVLTDQGLVPIERVTRAHRVWDGTAFVEHGGVVCQGIKEVIEHDGVRGTPDHNVYTECGRYVPLGKAKREALRLVRTTPGRVEARVLGRGFAADPVEAVVEGVAGLRAGDVRVPALQAAALGQRRQPTARADYALQGVRPGFGERYAGGEAAAIPSIPAGQAAVRERAPAVRRAGDRDAVRFGAGLCRLRPAGAAAQGLRRGGDRPHGQRRALRAWELMARDAGGERQQPHGDNPHVVAGPQCPGGARSAFVALRISRRKVRRHDGCPSAAGGVRVGRSAGLPLANDVVVQTARTWDVVDAGPNHRFTVSGRLVSNCLSSQYGVGGPKFRQMLWVQSEGEHALSIEQATEINQFYRKRFPMIPRFWRSCQKMLEAWAQGYLGEAPSDDIPLDFGFCEITGPSSLALKYPDTQFRINGDTGKRDIVFRRHSKTNDGWDRIYGGMLTENMSQFIAREVITAAVKSLRRMGVRVALQVHDEIVCVVPAAEADHWRAVVHQKMSTPPPWWPTLPVAAETHVGEIYGELK